MSGFDELDKYGDDREISHETNLMLWRAWVKDLQTLADDMREEIQIKQRIHRTLKESLIWSREQVIRDLEAQDNGQ